MPRVRRVTLRAQWLGKMLRDLREDRGYTLKKAAEYLQRDISAVSRFESGSNLIRRGDVLALIDLYRVDNEEQRDALLSLTGELTQTGWWDAYYTENIRSSTIDFVWLESRAEAISAFGAMNIPGLLQTEAHARALIAVANRNHPEKERERWVRLRMERQQILTLDEPVHLSAVIDEAPLRRPVGGREVHRKQMEHLLSVSELPNIDLQVLPFSAGAHASPDGSFTLVKLRGPFPEVAHTESPGGAIYVESDAVDRFTETYAWLRQQALPARESSRFIAEIIESL